MKVTELWVYPIKALRGISLDAAKLGPQGIQHDRRFMLCRVDDAGELTKIQIDRYPQCALFVPAIDVVRQRVLVRYLITADPVLPECPEHRAVLDIPLEPDLAALQPVHINLHQSLVAAYRMGDPYDAWFSACFGFATALVFIGDGRRPVLGSFSPKLPAPSPSWMTSLARYVSGTATADPEDDWLAFSDCAPYLVTTEQSLAAVSERLANDPEPVDMRRFRPNIVVDGEARWAEDFWAELRIGTGHVLALTKMCNRCASVNVDYETGRVARGERGAVLKKMMSDRRVDAGSRYSPVFGRYGFLTSGGGHDGDSDDDDEAAVAVGDSVAVTRRAAERPVWDWPLKDPKAARYYRHPV
ncbi:hypothetical protein G7046_g3523 [Stylonectria norvegica]|nr:hypothetical protein G7046_g3523 [Stylonectria norvegica]